jgi:hypothetical protein
VLCLELDWATSELPASEHGGRHKQEQGELLELRLSKYNLIEPEARFLKQRDFQLNKRGTADNLTLPQQN